MRNPFSRRDNDGTMKRRPPIRVDALLADIVAGFHASNMSRRQLAQIANVHPNSLRRFGQPGWNPSVHMIRRIESAIFAVDGVRILESDLRNAQ